jgi:putative restriction endonuclease
LATAIFLNGVFESVPEEILNAQKDNPGKVFDLQPHSESVMKHLEKVPPTLHSPVPLYISTSRQLDQVCYVTDIVGWEDKRELAKVKAR